MQQTRIRTQPHFALPESAALRPPGYICAAANASNAPASIRTQPHFALQESAALRPSGYICAAANASNAPASIRTQPHFALPESAALRPEGLHLRSNARSAMNSPHSQPLAFGAASCIWRLQRLGCIRSSSMPPGCVSPLRYIPLLSTGAKEPAHTQPAGAARA